MPDTPPVTTGTAPPGASSHPPGVRLWRARPTSQQARTCGRSNRLCLAPTQRPAPPATRPMTRAAPATWRHGSTRSAATRLTAMSTPTRRCRHYPSGTRDRLKLDYLPEAPGWHQPPGRFPFVASFHLYLPGGNTRMERRDSDIERDPASGDVHEHHSVVSEGTPVAPESEVVSSFNPGWRAVQLVYLVFGVIDGLLVIRLILKLLGANPQAAFANWVFNVTAFFMAPFHNLLPTIGNEQSQLEMSVVIAILVYALIAWAVGRFVAIVFYRNVTVARRTGRGLRPRGY